MPPPFPFPFQFNIGVDLLHVVRLRTLLSRRAPLAFGRRILTSNELVTFEQKLTEVSIDGNALNDDAVRYLAVRWAAKEAAYKASPCNKLFWKDIEVKYHDIGQPYLHISHNGAGYEGLLSISHDGEYVIAAAVVPKF